jgi:hypothetical protein
MDFSAGFTAEAISRVIPGAVWAVAADMAAGREAPAFMVVTVAAVSAAAVAGAAAMEAAGDFIEPNV